MTEVVADTPVAPAVVPEDRDYLNEMAEEVTDYLDAHESIVSAQAAEEIVTKLLRSDPDLLTGWLIARSKQILRDYIYTRSLSYGSQRHRDEQRGRFGKFSEGFQQALEEGADKGREFYRYHSVTEGPILVRKPLSAMTAVQVGEVRDRYRQAAKDMAFMGRIMEAVRKKVEKAGPDKVVSDVFSPEQLENLFRRQ